MRAPLRLIHLDRPGLRELALALWRAELVGLEERPRSSWPFGGHLTAHGWARFLAAMPEALAERDMAWLAAQLYSHSLWAPFYIQQRQTGPTQVRVNAADAAARLAHGEFNRAYIRAVVTMAATEDIGICTIVRAGLAAAPRTACTCLEGAVVPCAEVVAGLRAYAEGRLAEISIPNGPNCHHTVVISAWLDTRV